MTYYVITIVFPVSTGMNRIDEAREVYAIGVPRKHGDEPWIDQRIEGIEVCSP